MTVHCNLERGAHFTHAVVTQTADPFDKCRNRHALDGVEVDRTPLRDRIITGLEHDLTRKPTDSRRARSDQRATESRNARVAGEDHDGTARNVDELTPPHLTATRLSRHEAASASRNDAR